MTIALNAGDAPPPSTSTAEVPIRFQIGERTLFSAKRQLVPSSFGLTALAGGTVPTLAPLEGDADGYILRSLPIAQLDRVARAGAGFVVYVRETFPRYYVRVDGGFDAYLAQLSSSTRAGLRRKSRKFAELSGGSLDVREYRTPDEIERFHALAREVSRLTYQERLLDAGLPDTPAYRERMVRLAASGGARGYLLFLDGRPVSYLYVPIQGGCAIYAYLGYDPSMAAHSPGSVLQLFAFERLFGEPGIDFFDFTEGDGQHKRQFATGRFDCANVILLRPTAANHALVAAHRRFQVGVAWLADRAERAGVKARLKRLLRRSV